MLDTRNDVDDKTDKQTTRYQLGNHLGSGLLGEASGAAEVVGMRVGDEHGVDVFDGKSRALQPVLDRPPGARAGEARIHHGGSLAIEDRVAIHVTQSRHTDRKLHPKYVGTNLHDLGSGGLLLLSLCHAATLVHGPG